MKIQFVFDEIKIHIERIEAILPEIEKWLPLSNDDFNDIEKVKTLDSFIFRFIKIQDIMGRKLFPLVLRYLQEYDETMSLLDILNKLEKLEIIDSTDKWIDYRNLRNSLTHEYPGNEDEIVRAIPLAIVSYKEMKLIYDKIVRIFASKKEK